VKHGHTGQGGYQSPTYVSWQHMRARCDRPSHQKFKQYGARGIAVCDRWQTFANFLADVGERPDGTTLDRIDNAKGYEPGNCRWATAEQQNRNRRFCHRVTFRGQEMLLAEAAERAGLKYSTAYRRFRLTGSIE